MKTTSLTILLVFFCVFCRATNKVVIANSGQGWSNANNFSPNGVPQSGDSVTIPAGSTLTVKGNVYGSMSLLKIYIYGTLDFDPSGKLDLTVSSLVQIFSGGQITTNGSSSEIISMAGVVKYNGQNDGMVVGPKYASAATAFSNGIADDAGFNFGVLPLHILAFEIQAYNNEVVLNWKLNTQAVTDKYILQKRTTGDWEDIEQKTLNAGSPSSASFFYTDKSPGPGEVFYRLKLVHNDGRIEYSKVLMTRVNWSGNAVSFYPNPVKNKGVLTLKSKLNKGEVSVFTMGGVLAYQKEINSNDDQFIIDFSNFKRAGCYYVIVSDGNLVIDKTTAVLSP